MRLHAVVIIALTALDACSLLFDVGTLQSGPADASLDVSSDGTIDAPSDVDGAVDGSVEAATNLVPNGDFEQGTVGCGAGWATSGSTLSFSTDAHDGGRACRVCRSGADPWGIIQLPVQDPFDAGASWFASVFLKTTDASAPNNASLKFDSFDGIADNVNSHACAAPTSTWAECQTSVTRNVGGKTVKVEVIFDSDAGECVLIDDVSLYRL